MYYKCSRDKCGHVWVGRLLEKPKWCPNCKRKSVKKIDLKEYRNLLKAII